MLACIIASPAARAQEDAEEAAPLDFSTAAREAVSWHPSIVEAAGRLKSQEQRIDEVNAARYPQISGGIGTGYDSMIRGGFRPNANLDVSQRLYDFGKLARERDREMAGTRAARATVLEAVDAIIRDTSFVIIEILRRQDLRLAASEQLERVRTISALVDARFRRGAVTRSDAFQTQSRVDAAQSTIQQIDAEYARWKSNLAYLLGRDQVPPVAPEVPAMLETACQLPEVDWEQVPALQAAQARVEQAEAQSRLEVADRLPTVSVGASATRDLLDPLGDERGRYEFGLRINSNIFNGGAFRARARGAQFAEESARAAADATRLEATRQFAEARAQIRMLGERQQTLQRRFAVMQQTRELYRLQYLELGTRTLVDLLNADQELTQIRFEEINARYDLIRLGVDCLFASGNLRNALALTDMQIEGVAL